MRLKLDNTKTYAIALEGGGAKGAYHVGVWQALEEAGIKYNAVSGTSVGALNGAMMCMRDLGRATNIWKDIRFSDVIRLGDEAEEDFVRLVKGDAELNEIGEFLPHFMEIIKNRGLDVSPLREWVREVADCEKIRNSDVELFVTTMSLTDRKGLEIKINDMSDDEICDMLLASAYHPSFRQEKLGGKHYADGVFVDSLPIRVLVEHGYKDIIAVRIPGGGLVKPYKIPEDGSLTVIDTRSDLGGVLNFDAEQSRRNLIIGYLDAKRVLYGLYGEQYYIERTLNEREALDLLIEHCYDGDGSLRKFIERELPIMAIKASFLHADYYDVLIAELEDRAEKMGIEKQDIYSDKRLVELVFNKKQEV